MATTKISMIQIFLFFLTCCKLTGAQSGVGSVSVVKEVFAPANVKTELRFGRVFDPEKHVIVNVAGDNGEKVGLVVGVDSAKARQLKNVSVRSVGTTRPKQPKYPGRASNLNLLHTQTLLHQAELSRRAKEYDQRTHEALARQELLEELKLIKSQKFREQDEKLLPLKISRGGRKLMFEFDEPQSYYPQKFSEDMYFMPQNGRSSNRQPSFIPLGRSNHLSSPLERKDSPSRQWQPMEVYDLRHHNLQKAQQHMVPAEFGHTQSFPSEGFDNKLYRNSKYVRPSAHDNYAHYDYQRNKQPANLITKDNFITPKQKYVHVPKPVMITSLAMVHDAVQQSNINGNSFQQQMKPFNYHKNTKPYLVQSDWYPEPHASSTQSAVVNGPAVTVIEGVRVPDTPEDRMKTWRNARVLNNQLVPYPKGYTPPKVLIQTFDR